MYPVFVEIDGFAVDTYSVTAMLAFFAMVVFVRREGLRMGLGERHVTRGTFWSVVGCLVGGRAVYILVNYRFVANEPATALALWEGGLVSFGGISGSLAAVTIYVVRRKLPVMRTLDFACLAPHLAIAIGRIGCFCAGCDYGKPAPDALFSVVFEDPRSLVPAALLGTPLHPTQLYLSMANLVIFLGGYVLLRTELRPGRVFSAVAMTYAVARYAIEFLRGDADRGFVVDGVMSSGQLFCLTWFLVGLCVWIFSQRRPTISCS